MHNTAKTIVTELTADILSLENLAEGNYSLILLELSYKLLDSLRDKLFAVEVPLLTLDQARTTLDNTPVETSVEMEENKRTRSDGVTLFKDAFQQTKNALVALKAQMTTVSSAIEANASEVIHGHVGGSGEVQNVTVRHRQEAPTQRFTPNPDLKPSKLFINTSPYQFLVWKKHFTHHLESGTLNGQTPNDMVS